MFLLLPFFFLAFLLPDPTNGNVVFRICYVWAWLFFFLTGIRYKPLYKSIPDKNHSYIFVTNHISYLDIPMMILATRGRPIRILGKAAMGKIPIFGFIYNMGAVTVNRNNPEKRKESVNELKDFLKEKISILICPEGTFNMTHKPLKEFYNGAFRIAIEINKPIFPIIFPDTYDRLNYHSIFSLNPGKCRAVFLPPITTDNLATNQIPELKDHVYSVMKDEVVRLNATWMKEND